jgi:diaminopimelate decarboxylase
MLPGHPPPLAPADVYRPLTDLVRAALPDVRVSLEPGRAVVANAVIAAYEVMAVKRRPDGQVFVAVAGGMSDNPRPALYQSEYHALVDGRTGPSRPVTVVGHHCESGDVLIRSIDLPGDVAVGDCLLVAACGAYHLSMASNYNLTPRPALLAVTSTTVEVAVRRETVQEVLSRDSVVSRATHAGGALDRMAGHMSR